MTLPRAHQDYNYTLTIGFDFFNGFFCTTDEITENEERKKLNCYSNTLLFRIENIGITGIEKRVSNR